MRIVYQKTYAITEKLEFHIYFVCSYATCLSHRFAVKLCKLKSSYLILLKRVMCLLHISFVFTNLISNLLFSFNKKSFRVCI